MREFGFEVMAVPGAEALATLNRLKSENRGYPVLLGDSDSVLALSENLQDVEDSVEELIENAEKLNPRSWLITRAKNDSEYYRAPRGDWPDDEEPSEGLISHLDLSTGQPLEKVYIAMVPTTESWKVPCYLKMGGWNECPFPEVHASLFRKWGEEYGARVVAVTSSTIEFEVERPPRTRDEAITLAKEQYVYCIDIVEQGTETIEQLAASLLNGRTWFFWWD
ncbi:hypothetical protein HNQ59_003520 [Chitinivorax tropicus]|uniref:DUF4253 domain-containing protein n=1 Tax=Chitinivorax tropicus TaxID=714531 RepID=A0A840MV54_9PROT|nr:DUF4253 domain-containing protein [Chitinivorax tropicus]MBB5020203.1 hypothetical protein [Chitinivorax tropicus]